MRIKKLLAFICFIAILISSLCSCSQTSNEPEKRAVSYYDFFDTVSVIISYKGDSPEEFSENSETVRAILEDYHRMFDIYYEYSGINNLRTINKNAGKEPVKVDSRLIEFLLYAKEIYTLTNGKTNIAMGSVLKLWHDERENGIYDPESAAIPNESQLLAASEHTDINNIIIDIEASTVYLADPLMRLDVGAIGKGYATERAAQALIDSGVTSYVLNIGGNIRIIGEKHDSSGWITGITNPDKSSDKSFACRIEIKDTSIVTSGDYERYYFVGDVKYHHIIDPETNMPANYFASVSVITPDSALADALSTALFCMNYEDGLSLVKSIGGVEVIWIKHNSQILKTDNIELISD